MVRGSGLGREGFDHSTLSFNRERLPGSGAAEALLGEVARLAEKKKLLSSDRLVVDGTVIKAWASVKSFQPKEGPKDGGDFRGKKRSNATHQSTTDPDARLFRKGPGRESMLCHLGHVLVDAASGLVRSCRVTKACGLGQSPETLAALDMAEEHAGTRTIIVGDRGYDESGFVNGMRELGLRPHPRAKSKGSRLDWRTTKRPSYEQSMKVRYRPEPVFSWIKAPGRMRQTRLKGSEKVGWEFCGYATAFNLRRMAKLV